MLGLMDHADEAKAMLHDILTEQRLAIKPHQTIWLTCKLVSKKGPSMGPLLCHSLLDVCCNWALIAFRSAAGSACNKHH